MADISKITLPDNSQYNIKDSIARSGVLWYGTCNTLANTTEKAVTISGITSLVEGLSIRVKMLNEAAAASPTLNLNSLGAKAITRSAKPSLPLGYSRVLGFSMNDNSYFEIDNFKLTGADIVRFSFSMTANCNVFGCYTNSSATNNYSLFVSTSSTASYLRYNGGTYNSYIPTANRGQQLDIVITPHGVTGMPTDSSWTAKTFTASSDMCIGTSSPDASSASLIGNLYGAFIVDGRFNGIPCERLSDNALGYYDTYSKTFYEPVVGTPTSLGYDQNDYFDNAGTGEWAAGEVLDLVYDGTSWIIVDGAIADEETYGYTKLSDSVSSTSTNVAATANAVKTAYDLANGKQDALVSGTNIKTINNESLLGNGNITVSAEPEVFWATYGTTTNSEISAAETAGKICAVNVTIQDGPMSFPINCVLVSNAYDAAAFQCVYNSGIVEAVCAMDSWSVGTKAISLKNHTHGNITSAGDITATSPTIASGDKLIINDESASRITNGPAFGSSTTTFLRNDGSWAEPASGDSLPDQTGNTGKFLTTDGTDASWANLPSIPSPADANPLMDGTAAKGTSTDYAREDHVHPTDTSRAPTSHASTATTYGTGTSASYGHVKLSASTSSTSGVSDGIAATPSAVKAAYDLANGKYSKPNTGIPATDLESAVQTSLGKADTALQSESDPVFTASAAHGISSSDISNWNSKQDALVSGTNIKTINNESLLGSGNIPILAEPEIYICDSTTSYNDVVREYEAGKTLFYHRSISDGDFDDHTYLSLYAVQFNEESEIYLFQFSGIFNNHSYTYEIEGEVQTWSYHVTNLQTSLPSQSSQAGKFLTTNGSSMSWGSISIPAASITTPSMDGSASYGSGTTWARADHVHPSDTSRQAKITAQGLLEGDGAGNITAASTQSTNSISIDTVVTAESPNLITSGAVAAAIGGAGSTEIYWCTYGTTTSSQIETAYQAGKICAIAVPAGGISVTIDGTPTVVASEGEVYFLTYRKSSTEHRFVCAVPWTSNKILTMTSLWCNNDTWSVDFYDKEVSSIFWCTYGTTTSAQIEAAINEKKLVAVITNIDGQPCTHILTTRSSSTSHTFVCLEEYNQNFYLSYITCNSNSWARDYKNILTSLPSHASTSTTYGVGTTAYYGHLKLSDSTSSTNNTSNGTAATPSAVKSAYDRSATLTGRSSSPSTADTNYTTLITRGEKLLDATTYDAVSDWSSQLVNGSIAWRYE